VSLSAHSRFVMRSYSTHEFLFCYRYDD
jgi:hypothetical protein